MRRVLLVALAVLVLSPTAACAGEDRPGPPGPATALTLPARTTTAESPASSAPAPAADGDVAACFDGDCEVRVRDGTRITVDPRFEVDGVLVTVDDGEGRLRMETDTGYNTAGGVGSSTTRDDLTVSLLAVDGDTALVRFRAS